MLDPRINDVRGVGKSGSPISMWYYIFTLRLQLFGAAQQFHDIKTKKFPVRSASRSRIMVVLIKKKHE